MVWIAASLVVLYMLVTVRASVAWYATYRWLVREIEARPEHPCTGGRLPFLLILLPGLREQAVVQETVRHFSGFEYPDDRISIVLVTTEKEARHKQEGEIRLKDLCDQCGCAEKADADARAATGFRYNSPQTGESLDHRGRLFVPEERRKDRDRGCPLTTGPARGLVGLFPRGKLAELLESLEGCAPGMCRETLLECYRALPSTAEVIQAEIANMGDENRRFRHVHYAGTNGGKPTQLNYALAVSDRLVPEGVKNEETTYIGVYDFDSRPDIRTGLFVAAEVLRRMDRGVGPPGMLQQTQIPLSRFCEVTGKGLRAVLLKGYAVLHLRRSLGIELGKARRLSSLNRLRLPSPLRALLRPVIYGNGTGMFVRLSLLNKTGGFAEPIGDASIGYQACLQGEDIVPVPYLNLVEPYATYGAMSDSGSLCFAGAARIYSDYRQMGSLAGAKRLTRLERGALVAKEWIETSLWALSTPILWAAYACLLLTIGPKTGWLVFLGLPIFVRFFLDMALCQAIIPYLRGIYRGSAAIDCELPWLTRISVVLTAPVQGLVRILAPCKAIRKWIVKRSLGRQSELTKTER